MLPVEKVQPTAEALSIKSPKVPSEEPDESPRVPGSAARESASSNLIVVATGNTHKLDEIRAILGKVFPDKEFISVKELGEWPDPEETGTTFLDNALIKAHDALAHTKAAYAVADDSGLMVDALDGAPGVLSARWAGVHGDDDANNERLLNELADVDDSARRARFCSCVVFVCADGHFESGVGYCEGCIGREPRGTRGFGYDPLFYPDDTPGRTMAQLTPEEKNAISHRFHALTQLAGHLT